MNNLFFMDVSRGLVWNTIRSLFGTLDSIAYTLFSWVMQLIFDIAEVSTSDAFNNFYGDIQSRIYAVLAIFMLFKVTISMLSYLVNPDSISDKSNGVGKLSTRIIVSLVMLIAFPYAFQFLNKVQPHVLEALPRVILGTQPSSYADLGSQMNNVGDNIAFQTYNGVFFNTNCADEKAQEGVSNGNPCFQYENSVKGAIDHLNDPADGDNNSYKYDYMPLIGFVVAIVMTLILLGYCVDIAVRVFKLIILQLIAPIPIISYVDPKASKDGAFNKWIKMVISVWADLFIKLGIIYFIMLVISELFTSGAIQNLTTNLFGDSYFRGGLVTLALIVGLLFFAKDAPKFICDAMGIKMGENGKLFGGLGKIMSAGAIAAGTVGSTIAATNASWMADRANGKEVTNLRTLKNIGAGLVGGITGAATGIGAAVNAKDHNTKAAMDAMMKRNSKITAAGATGGTTLGGAASLFGTLVSGQSSIERMEADWKEEEEAIKYEKLKNAERKTIMDRASSKGLESYATSGNISNFKGTSGKTYNLSNANAASYNSVYESAMAGNGVYHTYTNGYGATFTQAQYNALTDDQKAYWTEDGSFFRFNGEEINMEDAKILQHEINDANIANYAEQSLAGTIDDAVITGANQRFADANNGIGVETTFGGSTGLKATYGKVNNEVTSRELKISNAKNSSEVKRKQANYRRFTNGGK